MAAKDNADTFIFYPTFLASIEAIRNEKVQLAMFRAVINYGLYGTLPDFANIDPMGTLDAAFVPIRYAIDEAKAKRNKYKEYGKLGGAPKGNKNAAKQPKTTHNNPKQGKQPYVYVNDNVNEDDILSNESKKSAKRFSAPTINEIQDFIDKEGLKMDANAFFDYYEANGWKVGRASMKDWKAAARNWSRREQKFAPKLSSKSIEESRRMMEVTATSEDDYKTTF